MHPLLAQTGAPVLLLHTGDLTQGGQEMSMNDELRAFAACSGDFAAIPGNHDLWPGDFPIFSASRTHLQFQRVRGTAPLPAAFPHLVKYDRPDGVISLWLLNSALSDSWPNSLALGKVEHEHMNGGWHDQVQTITTATGSRLKMVALHHPIVPFGDSVGTSVSPVTGPVAHVLMDARRTEHALLRAGVAVVLCGHEHRSTDPQEAIVSGGKLLQLPVGSPTLRGRGPAEAHLSLYCINLQRSIEITWATYYVETPRWSLRATFEYDGATWARLPRPDSGAIPGAVIGHKPPAPFP